MPPPTGDAAVAPGSEPSPSGPDGVDQSLTHEVLSEQHENAGQTRSLAALPRLGPDVGSASLPQPPPATLSKDDDTHSLNHLELPLPTSAPGPLTHVAMPAPRGASSVPHAPPAPPPRADPHDEPNPLPPAAVSTNFQVFSGLARPSAAASTAGSVAAFFPLKPASLSAGGTFSGNLGRMMIGNLLLTGIGLIAAGLVPFGFNFSVSHHYGAATLGLVTIALSLALLLGQIPGTISSGAAKFIAEALGAGDEAKAHRVFRFLLVATLGLSLVLAAGVVILAPVLERTFHFSFTMVALAACLIPTYALYLYFKSSYYGYHRVRTYLFNEILSDAAFFAVLLCVFLLGVTPWLLLPFVLNNAIFTLIAIADLGPRLLGGGAPEPGERRSVIAYCLVNGSGSVASLSRWQLGAVIAGWYLTSHSVGLFAAALALTAPLALLPRAISLVTFAMMARLHGAGESGSVRMLLQQSTEWLVLLLGIPSGLAILCAAPLLSHIFGPAFVPAAVATQLIIAGAYITDISRPSIDALSSTSHVRIATIASFSGLAVSVVLWLALIPKDGITAAALGFAAGAAVTALIPAFAAILYLDSNPFVFLRPAVMLLALAALIVVARTDLLVASTVFVGMMLVLFCHLLEEGSSFVVSLLVPERAGTATS